MTGPFETDALFACAEPRPFLSQTAHCTFEDPAGTLVAAAHDLAGPSRLVSRALSRGDTGRYEWDLTDSDGHRVLHILKPSQRLFGPSPVVTLANGGALGRAVPTKRLVPRANISLRKPDDTPAAELVSALGERREHPILMYRIVGRDRSDLGEILIQIRGNWGYQLVFHPDAPLAVRAMCIAVVVCLVQQRMPIGTRTREAGLA